MYVRGYLQGSKNGRVVTIDSIELSFFIRVIVPYERGYETSGSPLRFMLRISSLVECVSVLPGNRCLQNVEFFFFDNMFSHVC
jgi:hypothetical protein